jgi:hypothetical protein
MHGTWYWSENQVIPNSFKDIIVQGKMMNLQMAYNQLNKCLNQCYPAIYHDLGSCSWVGYFMSFNIGYCQAADWNGE